MRNLYPSRAEYCSLHLSSIPVHCSEGVILRRAGQLGEKAKAEEEEEEALPREAHSGWKSEDLTNLAP